GGMGIAARSGLVVAAAATIVVVHVGVFALVYRELDARTDARIAMLETAGSERVVVEPARDYRRDHWQYGEDLQNAYIRELIAHHLFGARSLELADAPAWAQPDPPETATMTLAYEPPLATDPLRDTTLGRHVPVQWPWVLRELRELWTQVHDVDGHRLASIDVTVAPPAPLPGARPIHLVTWRDDRFAFVDAATRTDPLGWPIAYVPE